MNSSEYQVTIKSANQKVDDYVTVCRASWTVQRLKQHISETHVNKPSVEDQRLIYAGNLLKDTHTLKQIFFRDSLCTELTNSNKSDFTIHLVCYTHGVQRLASSNAASQPSSSRPAPVAAPATDSTTSSGAAPQATGTNQPGSGVSNNPSGVLNSNSNNLGSGSPALANSNTPLIFNNIPSTSPLASLTASQQAEMVQNLMQSEQMRQQMAIFQQLAYAVAAQIAIYLANNTNRPSNSTDASNEQVNQNQSFMPTMNGQSLNIQTTISPMNNHITTTTSQMLYAANRQQTQLVQADAYNTRAGVPHNEVINNENNANAQGVGEPARPQFGYQAQMQAPAPVVEQPAPQQVDPELPIIQHDVIDWVYYSIRAAVLVAALYIHASMFRLLFIVALLAIAYFFNRRSNRRAAPVRQEPQPPPQELNVVDQQRAAQNDGELRVRNVNGAEQRPNVADNSNNESDNAQRAGVQDEAAPGRLPFFKFLYLVVTDFLASLVPE